MSPKRTLEFGGLQWRVKVSGERVGPGPNRFSDDLDTVRLDDDGLHLCLHHAKGAWMCAEIIARGHFGHGSYLFQFVGPLDRLDPNVVLGMFTWDPGRGAPRNRELDMEVARWGDPSAPNLNFVVQPGGAGRHHKAALRLAGTHSTYRMRWEPGRVAFDALHGHHGHDAASPGHTITSWEYRGSRVPTPGEERVRVNLWLRQGRSPLGGEGCEVVLRRFGFRPERADAT